MCPNISYAKEKGERISYDIVLKNDIKTHKCFHNHQPFETIKEKQTHKIIKKNHKEKEENNLNDKITKILLIERLRKIYKKLKEVEGKALESISGR